MSLGAIVLPHAIAVAGDVTSRDWWMQDDNGRFYAARLRTPAQADRLGSTVLLLGGGSVFDLNWTVPPSYEIDGNVTKVTIDGKETRDAETLATALANAGFVVMQWSSIHRDDEKAKESPALATGLPFPRTLELARLALTECRKQPEVDPKRLILLAHSLGATRACQFADDGVIGMVFLAGAYLSRLEGTPSEVCAAELARYPGLDTDGSATITAAEFDAWRTDPAHAREVVWTFATADKDRDGLLRPWEIAGARIASQLTSDPAAGFSPKPELRPGCGWPSDILKDHHTPTLAIFGGLDPMSIHGPILEHASLDNVRIEYIPARGHQLSPEENHLIGPIDPKVVERIVEWARQRAQ